MSAPSHMPIDTVPAWRPAEATQGWGKAAWWALGVHALLLAVLAWSVSGQQSDPVAIEAEMWSEIPMIEGGAVQPPPPVAPAVIKRVEPPKAPEPEPEHEPESKRPPDIVVEKKVEPKKPEPRKTEPKPAIEKPAIEKPVAPKPEAKKAEPPKKEVVKPVESKVTSPQSKGLTAAELEAQRQANLQRMMSSLGEGSAGAGQAAKSSGPSAGYAGRIIARVKPHIRLIETLEGNPHAVVEVHCSPDGRIISQRLVKSSGNAVWDDTVLRALDRTEVLPADVDGRVPSPMQLSFKLRDF